MTSKPPANAIYRPLSDAEIRARDQALAFLAEVSGLKQPIGVESLQRVYDKALDENVEADTNMVVALGIAFGQTFLSDPDFEWVRLHDEYGQETVIALKGYKLNAAPVSMIDKRLKRRERIDLAELRRGVIARLREIAGKDGVARR